MTDLEKLKEVLLNQAEKGIKNGDWPECEAVTEKDEQSSRIFLRIPAAQVVFAFNRNGRFVGICNFKE